MPTCIQLWKTTKREARVQFICIRSCREKKWTGAFIAFSNLRCREGYMDSRYFSECKEAVTKVRCQWTLTEVVIWKVKMAFVVQNVLSKFYKFNHHKLWWIHRLFSLFFICLFRYRNLSLILIFRELLHQLILESEQVLCCHNVFHLTCH